MTTIGRTLPESARYDTGVVVIGRNEGTRLQRCLESVLRSGLPVVYVDSGSTDGSVQMARSLGAEVVELDLNVPFTAARARNEGCTRLLSITLAVSWIQFVDGDCEMCPGWLCTAREFMEANPGLGAVCGRRLERRPDDSVYNRLCDLEWDTPVGEAKTFGGDVMVRREAFQVVGGYRAELIAGEDPELALRLRMAGWGLWRLEDAMTLHDAAITHWGQWWQRNVRSGHAFAEGCSLHGHAPVRHFFRETIRAVCWGALLPSTLIIVSAMSPWASLLALMLPAQWLRLGLRFKREGSPIPWRRAGFLLLGRLPEAQGVLTFAWHRTRRLRSRIIEYK